MRVNSIDILRGIAIFIMISANSYPYLYPYEYCPKLIRLIFSSAAPIFIFLSGVSSRLAQERGKRNKLLFLRALQILFFGVLIDIFIWSISPFYTMDVLYLISFSLLINILLHRFSDKIKLIFALIIILSILFTKEYYSFVLNEITTENNISERFFSVRLRHLMIDGWFPIIPWAGFSILGYLVCKYRFFLTDYSRNLLGFGLSLIFFFMLAIQFSFISPNTFRNGYTEIFYPVSFPFLLYILGIYLIITFLININLKSFTVLNLMGKYALPSYIIHIVLIKFYIPIFSQTEKNFRIHVFLMGILSMYFLVFMFLYFVRNFTLKSNIKGKGLILFLLGL